MEDQVHMRKVLNLMIESQIPQADLSEEELKQCLYGKSPDRLNILKWMVSQFHEEYKAVLEKSYDLRWGKLENKRVISYSNTLIANLISALTASCDTRLFAILICTVVSCMITRLCIL